MHNKIYSKITSFGIIGILPIILLLLAFFGWSYGHKLYTDHNTYCTIIRLNPTTGAYSTVRHEKIRKSSIKMSPSKYLEFVSPETDTKLKFVGKLNYAVVCPTNLRQDEVIIKTDSN